MSSDLGGQAHDRVNRELTRAVPCGLPAPIDIDDGHMPRFNEAAVGALPGMRSAAHRVDGFILQQLRVRLQARGSNADTDIALRLQNAQKEIS